MDIVGALVASTIANVNRGKNSRAASVDDFMIVANSIKTRDVANDEARHLKMFILSMGGKVS